MKTVITTILIAFALGVNAQYGPADSTKAEERIYSITDYAYDIGKHTRTASIFMVSGTILTIASSILIINSSNDWNGPGIIAGAIGGGVGLGLIVGGGIEIGKISNASRRFYEDNAPEYQ